MTVRLVVVGDALLDRDLVGTVERVAPDAPVPVLAATGRVDRPGGAALAAALAATDGVEVTLVAPVPDDAGGRRLRALLDQAGVTLHSLPVDGPMPEKIRIRAGGHLLIRVDQAEAGDPRPDRLPRAATAALHTATGVLVSDYGRGATSLPELRRLLTEVATRRPVVWDPHPRGTVPVPGVRLATPNEAELAHFTGREPVGARLSGVAARAARLCGAWQVSAVAVTLGADGALVAPGQATPLVVPAPPCVAYDTCGAGDRFAAAVAAALIRGAVLSEAATQAVTAASAYVAAGGAAGWRPKASTALPETAAIGLDAARAVVGAVRLRGGTVVATGGCFDLLHVGHLSTLRAARKLGDSLVVFINSDQSICTLKGPTRPVVPGVDRARLVAALDCVDAVVMFDEPTPDRLLDQLRPDIWVKGGDYFLDGPDGHPALPEAELVRRWGGQAVIVPYLSGRSSTALIAASEGGSA
jgi:rfaE bifunctional protein nucleotidyltransferase chain/domain/rfaE bifunctional protein kinase chain/domain